MAVGIPSESEVLAYMDTLSNWGRWGPDDQLGTLNHISAAKRVAAASLVREGITISCARPVVTNIAADTSFQVVRHMVDSGEGREHVTPDMARASKGAAEFIGMVFHGRVITHVDSLSHYFFNGKMYNGKPASLVTTREGAKAMSVENAHQGIFTRGILLDVAATKGLPWMEPSDSVMPDDLDAAEEAAGVTVSPGDIVLVRTGHYRRREELGPWDSDEQGQAACHPACLPWFRERQIAMLGTDTSNENRPVGYEGFLMPFHTIALVAMGLWLIDNCNLEELAKACLKQSRRDFLLTVNPLRLRNATGSPVNPVATF